MASDAPLPWVPRALRGRDLDTAERCERIYYRELERVRLRAMLAAERLASRPDPAVIHGLQDDVVSLEEELAKLRPGCRTTRLMERLGLDDDERDLLWTAVAVAADARVLPHAQVLGGTEARRGLSLSLHTLIADVDGERVRALVAGLLAGHPLLREQILAWPAAGEAPTARPLVVPARTISWLAGCDQPDEAMLGAGGVVSPPHWLEQDAAQRRAGALLQSVLAAGSSPLIVVEGQVGAGRRTAVAAAAGPLGRPVVALDLRRVPKGGAALEGALAALRRECCLRDAIPLLCDIDEVASAGDADDDGQAAAARAAVVRAFDRMGGPLVVTASRPGVELPVARPVVRVGYGIAGAAVRRKVWARALGGDAARVDDALDGIALRFPLGAGAIHRAVTAARLVAGEAPLGRGHIVGGIRGAIAERFGDLAVRHEVRQTWDDLVLEPDLLDQVRALIARVEHSSRVLEQWGFAAKLPGGAGVAALLSGPPGTGKTMVAGLIARKLDLELYQVDLSKVVSKWIGETEKQMARVFAAAEAGHALLLFDEADALFARRTEVKSSNDRHANLEVNYLLQRIERFGGVTILTTNLDTQLDPALRRRLAAHIIFPAPGPAERELLWRRMLGEKAPTTGRLDLAALAARFSDMTGANIRNAVLSAAFLAAAEGSSISQAHLEDAARGEYASMGRVLGGGPGQRQPPR